VVLGSDLDCNDHRWNGLRCGGLELVLAKRGEDQQNENVNRFEQEAARAILRNHGVVESDVWAPTNGPWCAYGRNECSDTLWLCPSEELRDATDMMLQPHPTMAVVPIVMVTNSSQLSAFMLRAANSIDDDALYELYARLYRLTPGTIRYEA